jgi:hypothetical protein
VVVVRTDTDNSRDVFRYDADTGQLIRVSTNTAGIGGNADNLDATVAQSAPIHAPHHINTAITKNGEMIAFSSPEQLSPQDGNELSDVYLWSSGKVHMITTGGLNGGGEEGRLTGSGRDLYFQTREPLSQADPDLVFDVYDARIDGGFSFKTVPACSGEGCQPAGTRAQGPAPATGGGGSGNVGAVSIALSTLSKPERKALAASGKATLRLNASAPGQLDLKGTAKLGSKRGQVFAASLYVEQPGDVNLPISLSKRARKQLSRDGKLAIELTIEFGDAKPKTSTLVLKK